VCAAYRRLLANGHLRRKIFYSTSSRGCGCKFAGRYFRVFYRKMHYFIPPYRILLPNMGKKHTYSQHLLGHQPLPFYFPFPSPCLLHLNCVVGLCIFISSHGRWFVVLAYLPSYSPFTLFLSPPSPNLITCSFVWYYSYDNLQYMRNAVRKHKLRIL